MDIREVIPGVGVRTRPATPTEQAEITARNETAAASRLAQWRSNRVLSRLHMGEALVSAGILDHAQALHFLAGSIPAPLQAMIDLLPQADRPTAERATAGARDFERNSPLWAALAAAETGPTESEIDAMFGWDE